jgi:tetratricopeptide (TPR) repeat protein
VDDFSRVIELEPGQPDAYYLRGALNFDMGNLEAALADLNHVVDIAPDQSAAYLLRGSIYNLINEDAKSASDYLEWTRRIETRHFDGETLESGQTRSVDMAEGWVYQIPFSAQAGQLLSVEALGDSTEVDPLIVILDKDGVPIIASDNTGRRNDAEISAYPLPDDGMYTLILSHALYGSTGVVNITLELQEP